MQQMLPEALAIRARDASETKERDAGGDPGAPLSREAE
jgi:hypothetical protein